MASFKQQTIWEDIILQITNKMIKQRLNTYLSIISLVLLGICLVCFLLKLKKIGYGLLFLAIVLLAIHQIINSTHKKCHAAEFIKRQDKLPSCYIGGGESEWGERAIAKKHTKPFHKVLEFGGGAGSVTTTFAQRLVLPLWVRGFLIIFSSATRQRRKIFVLFAKDFIDLKLNIQND